MSGITMNMTDYEATREQFKLLVPDSFNFTRDVVEMWAKREPSRPALIAVGSTGQSTLRWSFGELASRARRAANFLQALGVKQGNRLFVMLPRVTA